MGRLIDNLFDYASIRADRFAVRRLNEAPRRIVTEVLGNFEVAAQEKQLTLAGEIEGDLPTVDCDHERILQVFSNLIGNALRVTSPGGSMDVASQGSDLSELLRRRHSPSLRQRWPSTTLQVPWSWQNLRTCRLTVSATGDG
jgi:signal transduction histidine kinase